MQYSKTAQTGSISITNDLKSLKTVKKMSTAFRQLSPSCFFMSPCIASSFARRTTQRRSRHRIRKLEGNVDPYTRHKGTWGSGVIAPLIRKLTNRGERSDLPYVHLMPGERALGIHWKWGWMGPRAGVDALEREIISSSCRNSNHDCSVARPTA